MSRPEASDLELLGNGKRIVDIDPEIPDRALDLGVTEQELDGSEIAGSPVDHRRLRATHRMRAIGQRIEPNRPSPGSQQSCILARAHRPRPIDPAREQRLALVQAFRL
jgi:hypothetical protein